MTINYWDAIKQRRTHYAIGNEPVTSDDIIETIVNEAVKHTPSSFNSQSGRAVVLLGEQHEKLWDIAKDELRKIVPPENFKATEEKIDGAFRSGYGTILFFEDMDVVAGLQEQFPSIATTFQFGQTNHQACFNLQSGLHYVLKVGGHRCNTIIRLLTAQ